MNKGIYLKEEIGFKPKEVKNTKKITKDKKKEVKKNNK